MPTIERRKILSVRIPTTLVLKLKLYAASEDRTIEDIVIEALQKKVGNISVTTEKRIQEAEL